jgi:PIN domain nuclease of toxin-antitoxin system
MWNFRRPPGIGRSRNELLPSPVSLRELADRERSIKPLISFHATSSTGGPGDRLIVATARIYKMTLVALLTRILIGFAHLAVLRNL